MKQKLIILLIILLTVSNLAFNQTWSTTFTGIDSIWSGGAAAPKCFYNDGDSVLYIGGIFLGFNTTNSKGILKWDGEDCYNLQQGVTGIGGVPECLKMYDNKLFMGGGFSEVDNQPNTDAMAIWDGNNWFGIPGLPTSSVWDFEVYHDTLFIAYQLGDFQGMIAYDGTSLIDITDLSTNWMKTLEVYNDTLYAGGYTGFFKYKGGTTWVEAHGGTNERVNDMVVDTFNNFLYVGGGGFTVVGGNVPAYPAAMWDGFSWTSLGTIPNWAIYPKGMAVYRGDLYIGGYLEPYAGKVFNNIARWDGTQWDSVGCGVNQEIWALEVFQDELYVGGYFDYVDDTIPAYGLARWHVPDTGCNYLKPRVQVYADTIYMSNGEAEVQFYNNNAYVQTWDWDFGDGNTANIKDPLHTYTDKGDYSVCVTVNDTGCVKTACKNINIAWIVGEEELAEETGMRIFPNPTDGSFTVEVQNSHPCLTGRQAFGSGSKSFEIKILGLNGHLKTSYKLSGNETRIEVPTEGWQKGTYLVCLVIGGKLVKSEKVVLN